MTSPIPGYGSGIPDDLVLGYICWYAVADPHLTHEQLFNQVAALPLDPFIMPSPPRLGDAFKRACRYSERKGLAIPNTDHTGNILIRSVSNTGNEIERHMVLEIVDAEGKVLEYHDCAHLTLDRIKSTLRIRTRTMAPNLEPLIQSSLAMFNENFDNATKHIEPQVLRRMIRLQLDAMSAIGVRREGSVYFYPPKYHAKGEALEALLSQWANGSTFHTLPLVDTSKQREMVKAALEAEMHDEASQIITEIQRFKEQKQALSVRQFTDYRDRYQTLKLRASDYESLIKQEMSKVDTELLAMDKHLTGIIEEGLIS